MNSAIRLIHCASACLTGILIIALATTISYLQGSPVGVALGFVALILGYATAVGAVGEKSVTITLALLCWVASLFAVAAAIVSLF